MSKRIPVKRISATVAKAVGEAHSATPGDDRAFFDELKARVAPVMPPRPAVAARSMSGESKPKRPRLRSPWYKSPPLTS